MRLHLIGEKSLFNDTVIELIDCWIVGCLASSDNISGQDKFQQYENIIQK
jgi:hypothetical protein